ncbi:MAG: copper transporter [Actinomycetota bacterium]|nr:copper transporter [Actinomycetota bacterium]
MISFRYHIVSIVSVFLALAIGVALGGGPLKGEVDNTLVEQVENDRMIKRDLKGEIAALRSGNDFLDAFAQTVAPELLRDRLERRPVTVMVAPSAERAAVASVTELITVAGGSVGSTLRIGADMVDVANKQLVEELGTQLLEGTPGVDVAQDASGYERMGALLARAVGTERNGGAVVDEAANGIISGLSTAGLMSPEGDLERRGNLVVLVAGPGTGSSEEKQGANTIIGALAKAIDADTDGVVVAGPVASAREDGLVESLRQDVVAAREVSTVDSLGRTAGEVVTVLALAGQARGETGHYGAVDAADGAMPGATPAD